jgi:flagellar protein FlgJ
MNQLDIVSTSLQHPGTGRTEQQFQHLRSIDKDSDPEQVREAAQKLEAYFLHVLMREMRKTVPPNPILYGGKTEEIFQDFLDEEIAKKLAISNQLGLADLVCRSIENRLKQTAENADKEMRKEMYTWPPQSMTSYEY